MRNGRQQQLWFGFLAIGAMIVAVTPPAQADRIDVTTPGNLLALLPTTDLASSTKSAVAFGLPSVVNNLVGTSNQDDGLVFEDTDTDQRLTVTGFNSALTDIRVFTAPDDGGRFPGTLAVYYSTVSTTSLNAGGGAYSGTNGGLLEATLNLTPAMFTLVPGANQRVYRPPCQCTRRYSKFVVRFWERQWLRRSRWRGAGF